ncbi:hypothetical protein OROMI_001652 [Orobanche minor]
MIFQWEIIRDGYPYTPNKDSSRFITDLRVVVVLRWRTCDITPYRAEEFVDEGYEFSVNFIISVFMFREVWRIRLRRKFLELLVRNRNSFLFNSRFKAWWVPSRGPRRVIFPDILWGCYTQEILKIRDGTPLEAEEILIYIKKPSNQSVWSSQEILKIRDGTPLEAEEILIYIKKPSNKSVWHFSSKLDILSNVVQKKRVARILFFKIRPSQEILKIRHGTPLETEEILTYIKSPQNRSFWHFYSNLDVSSNVVHKKRVARNLFIKIRPSQEILKIRDGTSLEMEEILTYIKKPSKQIDLALFEQFVPSQEILKIRHGTPLETEEILTYIKSPQNRSFWQFYSNLDVPSNVVQKKRVVRNLFIKIRPSQGDGTSLEMEEILTYIKKPSKQIVLALL